MDEKLDAAQCAEEPAMPTDPMTDEQAEEMRERWEAATPGTWKDVANTNGMRVRCHVLTIAARSFVSFSMDTADAKRGIADCSFIAHAHQDVPALLDERDRLKAEVAGLKEQVEFHCERQQLRPQQ